MRLPNKGNDSIAIWADAVCIHWKNNAEKPRASSYDGYHL